MAVLRSLIEGDSSLICLSKSENVKDLKIHLNSDNINIFIYIFYVKGNFYNESNY